MGSHFPSCEDTTTSVQINVHKVLVNGREKLRLVPKLILNKELQKVPFKKRVFSSFADNHG